MNQKIIKIMNALISFIVVICLTLAGTYAIYALWDNHRIYTKADNVQSDMLKLKPVKDDSASFADLLAINSDVCAWLTLDHTNIDYPVLQGEDNLTYINMDVYGDFALAGSIYLDSRNDQTFNDMYSLVYGHHMAEDQMFGDLDLYMDKEFFNENTTGELLLPDGSYELEIFACLVISASENNIYDPTQWKYDTSGLISYVRENSLHLHEEKLTENMKVIAFSTCSSDYTDARTVVLALMK